MRYRLLVARGKKLLGDRWEVAGRYASVTPLVPGKGKGKDGNWNEELPRRLGYGSPAKPVSYSVRPLI